jgi:hypothetical protein
MQSAEANLYRKTARHPNSQASTHSAIYDLPESSAQYKGEGSFCFELASNVALLKLELTEVLDKGQMMAMAMLERVVLDISGDTALDQAVAQIEVLETDFPEVLRMYRDVEVGHGDMMYALCVSDRWRAQNPWTSAGARENELEKFGFLCLSYAMTKVWYNTCKAHCKMCAFPCYFLKLSRR